MFCRVNLYTTVLLEGDSFVQAVTMPIYYRRPEVIQWGARYFAWHARKEKYVEALCVVAVCDERGKSVLGLPDEAFPLVNDVQRGAAVIEAGKPLPRHKRYTCLATPADLAESSVEWAIKEIGVPDITQYDLYVHPSELEEARRIMAASRNTKYGVRCFQEDVLKPGEWYIVGGGIAVGSTAP